MARSARRRREGPTRPFEGVRKPLKVLHAVAHLMVDFALLAFVWLTLAFWNTGFRADFVNQGGRTRSAVDASQYVHGHLGVGLFLLTLGVIVVSVVLIKEILALVGLVILVTIGLAVFDRPGLGSFYHLLHFDKGRYYGSLFGDSGDGLSRAHVLIRGLHRGG